MSGTDVFVGDTGVCDPPALEVTEEGTGDWVVKLPSLDKNEFQAEYIARIILPWGLAYSRKTGPATTY
jgi:hypothetical protein